MKKYILFFFALFLYVGASATDLTGVKIYINPGHGGYDADDRNVATIPFALGNHGGFYESSSSLTKGLALRDLLEAQGATVFMSRLGNTSADDRNLTEIAEEANASNADSFISIHSNAANGVANYLLILFRGTDALPDPALGKPMADAAWNRMVKNPLVMWSHYGEGSGQVNTRGDFSYYNYHLGVLGPNAIPGFLSEGSFHDYLPETHRFLNLDYRRLEAERFFRYYCDYFGADLPLKSVVAGTVKDKYFSLEHSLYKYKAGSDDAHKPIHGATVLLKDAASKAELQRYTTDNYYNGVYVFYNVDPGNYKVVFEAEGYATMEEDLLVKPDGDMYYVKAFMRDLTVEIPVPPTYPDPTQEGGVLHQNNYLFDQVSSGQPAWLDTSRKILFSGNEIYSLNDNGTVSVVNSTTNAVAKTLLAKKGESTVLLSDIALTSNGQLVAIEKASLSTSATKVTTYIWAKDATQAGVLFQSDYKGTLSEALVGESMTFVGAPWNYQLYTTARAANGEVSVIAYKSKDGEPFVTSCMKSAIVGSNITMTPSPYADNQITVDSELMYATNFEYDWTASVGSNLTALGVMNDPSVSIESNGGTYFKYAKHVYMAMPICDAGGANVKVKLFDVSSGLTSLVALSEAYPEAGLGSSATTVMAAAGQVSGYDITLLIAARGQGYARYKTLPAKKIANIFASELKYDGMGENVYAVSYVLNEVAASVEIQFVVDGDVVATKPSVGLAKGLNEIVVDISDLPEGAYTWQIKAVAASIVTKPIKYSDDTKAEMQFYKPFGVAIDNDFESPYFGRLYVSETLGGKVTGRTTTPGVFILNSSFDDVTQQGGNGYKGGETWKAADIPTMRLSVADNRVFITDATAAHSGVYVMDASNPTANFTPVFDGVRDQYGLIKNGSTRLASPSVDCYVSGQGENAKLFTFDTDWLVSGNLSSIHQYNIGTAQL